MLLRLREGLSWDLEIYAYSSRAGISGKEELSYGDWTSKNIKCIDC